MSDNESYNYYADPDNREPVGPGRRRAGKSMSSHIPVRFRPEIIAEVKRVASDDRKTVSSWIRDVIERELERRRPHYPYSKVFFQQEAERLTFTGTLPASTITRANPPVLEDA